MSALTSAFLFLAQIVGGDFTYTVQPRDSLTSVGARFGIDVRVIVEANDLKAPDILRVNQQLRLDNRHIVPSVGDVDLVINIPQRMLFYFDHGPVPCASPIAAGRTNWRTPTGPFEIVTKEEKPVWDVPVSIQEEMRRAGRPVLTRVLPSPQNPLGEYWIGLSFPAIGIHGTNAPLSIYKLVTHGCIRLHPDDVRSLFDKVGVGMRGRIIYEPVLLGRAGDSVFLEVHPDAYGKESDPLRKVLAMAQSMGLLDRLDLLLVKEVIRKRDGIARDVTRR